jgi:uncharacterized protein (TIGR02391 family)
MPIPDLDTLLGMEPEELGAHLLMAIREEIRPPNQPMVHPNNHLSGLSRRLLGLAYDAPLPREREDEVHRAMTEAWAWLEAQGLLVPGDRWNGGSGWRVPSRRAMRFSGVDEFVPYAVARRLDPTILHPRIRATVWSAIVRGHFEIAAFTALKAVEVAVRGAAGYGHDRYGRDMMAMAFNPEGGPLTDMTAEKAERSARRDLFCGVIGSYKNALSHRDVDLDDPAEAVEVVMLANHLLRIVDRQVARSAQPPS